MIFRHIFLAVSLINILHDFRVSSCGNCTDKPVFTPSGLVVKFGDSTSARCSVCQHCHSETHGLEIPVGVKTENGTTLFWTVDTMTEWDTSAMCYYNDKATGCQCDSTLPVTVYQPPHSVSISFVNHTGPMLEGHQYTLQCTVRDVAPVEKLTVTFYKGQTVLGQQQFKNNTKQKTPVTEIVTLNITPREEDDGVQYRSEATLELGPEGPQPPPVVTSESITATVYYKPQLMTSSPPDPIIITEGNPLQLNCTAVGNPSPSYTWLIPSNGPATTNSSVLTINSIKTADKGQYTCFVKNDMDTLTVMFDVDVQADYTVYIIVVIIIAAAVLAIIVVFLYVRYYKHNKMGKYNLKDVFRFHTQHSAVPIAE